MVTPWGLTNRWSARVKDKVPGPNVAAAALSLGVRPARRMASIPPLEIMLPDVLVQRGVPDIRIASKFLALLVESNLTRQHLEVFEGMPLVNSPSPAIKQFLTTVNGARQLDAFVEQVKCMLFPARTDSSMGSLCCVVAGVFTEFELTECGRNAMINWDIARHAKRTA